MWHFLNDFLYTRSFSALWFWIAGLGVVSLGVRGVMDIPVRLVNLAWRETRASPWGKNHGAENANPNPGDDIGLLTQVAHAQARARIRIQQRSVVGRVAFVSSIWSALTVLAFVYQMELARAAWLLLTPIIVLMAINAHAAWRISSHPDLGGVELADLMLRYNVYAQMTVFSFMFIIFIFAYRHAVTMGYIG
jgi:hypothetical protein